MPTLREVLNQANPSMVAGILQKIGFGDVVRSIHVQLRRANTNKAPTDMIAAVHSIKLPDHAKCGMIVSAYALAGGAAAGPLTVDAGPMTVAPAAGHVNFTESGDLAFAAGDAWTSVDVLYLPTIADVIELTLPVVAATGIMAIPAAYSSPTKITRLYEASAITPAAADKAIVIPGVVPVVAGTANLALAKNQVQFVIADAVTRARVKLGLVAGTNGGADLNTLLESDASPYL